MITYCHLCATKLIYENYDHKHYYYCDNVNCPGISSSCFFFNFQIKNNKINHLYIPIYKNNITYTILSSHYDTEDDGITEIHKYKSFRLDPVILIQLSVFTPFSLDFIPEAEALLDKYIKLKAFL